MPEFIHWATLAYELGQVPDLDIDLAMPGGGGRMAGSPFTITLTNVRDDGFRDHMLLSLTDQDEAQIIPHMTAFMGYSPFCKYSYDPPVHKDVTVTYEWDCRDPEGRFRDIESGKEVKSACNLVRLEDGFKKPQEQKQNGL